MICMLHSDDAGGMLGSTATFSRQLTCILCSVVISSRVEAKIRHSRLHWHHCLRWHCLRGGHVGCMLHAHACSAHPLGAHPWWGPPVLCHVTPLHVLLPKLLLLVVALSVAWGCLGTSRLPHSLLLLLLLEMGASAWHRSSVLGAGRALWLGVPVNATQHVRQRRHCASIQAYIKLKW